MKGRKAVRGREKTRSEKERRDRLAEEWKRVRGRKKTAPLWRAIGLCWLFGRNVSRVNTFPFRSVCKFEPHGGARAASINGRRQLIKNCATPWIINATINVQIPVHHPCVHVALVSCNSRAFFGKKKQGTSRIRKHVRISNLPNRRIDRQTTTKIPSLPRVALLLNNFFESRKQQGYYI